MDIRTEDQIFFELSKICTSPGYAHAIAHFCFRDNFVKYKGEMTDKDMESIYGENRLVRTEISTLIGLMLQSEIDLSEPLPNILKEYIEKTETLLEEMHKSFLPIYHSVLEAARNENPDYDVFARGDLLREPIFYGHESAYPFQYIDLSVKKYNCDNDWLLLNKGFTIENAKDIIRFLSKYQEIKLAYYINKEDISGKYIPLLNGFIFSIEEVSKISGIDKSIVISVVESFSVENINKNLSFKSLNDFNIFNANPLLKIDSDKFILYQIFSLTEALYESPFYWMISDKKYISKAMKNRGDFSEDFCQECLLRIFKKENIYSNIIIKDSKDNEIGEIDQFVLFGNRAIVLQAKSKRLTLESRKGNDGAIKEDFKKSVEDSYIQGLKCSEALSNPAMRFIDSSEKTINIPPKIEEIYLLCIVSDHYPALSFQTTHLLKTEKKPPIKNPLVFDLFSLDVISEMLDSPLYFLSYLNRRENYSKKLIFSHETNILSHHIVNNLWIDLKTDMFVLPDEVSIELDVAMAVRRDGVPGKRTPDGILTKFKDTTLGHILNSIETNQNSEIIDFGFFILTLSEKLFLIINDGINKIIELQKNDGKNHDMSFYINESIPCLIIHCNEYPYEISYPRLYRHCETRKYVEKSKKITGICINPKNISIDFCLNLDYPWVFNEELQNSSKHLKNFSETKNKMIKNSKQKLGRNEPCFCGSGLKFKKCCINKN